MNNLREYSAIPFWLWNGEATESEITRQLEMAAAGHLRGMTIHARAGNRIEYMSERWITLFRHACAEARRLGLEIWIYDEEGWPSGTVGGRIFDDTDFYRQKTLRFGYFTAVRARQFDDVYSAFYASDISRICDLATAPDDTRVLLFRRWVIPEYNYCDTLIPETVRKFIAMTHDVYAEKLGEFFGDPITAIYTDDLNLMQIYTGAPVLPFSDRLMEEFSRRNGYDLRPMLPLLIEDIGEFRRVRFDFRKTVMDMFLEFFVDPLRVWCEKHSLPLTGHLSGDEGPWSKAIGRYSSAMPFFVRESVPGIDEFLLGHLDGCYMSKPVNHLNHSMVLTAKMLVSAANQYGNGHCSSEVLTSLGWGIPMETQMATIRFQIGLGIDVMVPHSFSYATHKIAKRDHPASYFFQQPAFRRLGAEFYDTIARDLAWLTDGRYQPDMLLILPIYSAWQTLGGYEIAPKEYAQQFKDQLLPGNDFERDTANISWRLLRAHAEFEYGDELLLAQDGRIEQKRLSTGRANYSTVLLVPDFAPLASTCKLLDNFAAAGGRILGIADGSRRPDYPCECIDFGEIEAKLAPELPFDFADAEAGREVLVRRVETADGPEFMLLNYGMEALEVAFAESGFWCDSQTEKIEAGNRFQLPHLGARHWRHHAPGKISPAAAHVQQAELKLRKISPNRPNTCILDCGICNGKHIFFGEETPAAGSRVEIILDIPEYARAKMIYSELANIDNAMFNGRGIDFARGIPHDASPDLRGIDISLVSHAGRNVFSFTARGARIEQFYLEGDFAVELEDSGSFALPKLCAPTAPHAGDLSTQGFPFYWGSVDYEFDYAPGLLKFPHVDGVLELFADGRRLGAKLQSPWEWILDDCGARTLTVRIYNTAQNFFGPQRQTLALGSRRNYEGSSDTAFVPPCRNQCDSDWCVARFGITLQPCDC